MTMGDLAEGTFQLTPSRRATSLNDGNFTSTMYFNSRPHGGRPERAVINHLIYISTHALTEGDDGTQGQAHLWNYFNSRPHGGRLSAPLAVSAIKTFQLTPSRRATLCHIPEFYQRIISTHALTEGDSFAQAIKNTFSYFNSRPHGGRELK